MGATAGMARSCRKMSRVVFQECRPPHLQPRHFDLQRHFAFMKIMRVWLLQSALAGGNPGLRSRAIFTSRRNSLR